MIGFLKSMMLLATWMVGVRAKISGDLPDIQPKVTLQINDDYTLVYQLLPSSASVTFTLTVKTLGWVGIGFGNDGMNNADVIWGSVSEDGTPTVYDGYSTGYERPTVDSAPDYKNSLRDISGSISNESTTISFTRDLKGEDEHDKDLVIGENNIIWAYAADSSKSIEFHRTHCGREKIDLKSSWISSESNKGFIVKWFYPEHYDVVQFGMIQETTGYIGMGFGENMHNTNIVTGYFKNGEAVIDDRYATGNHKPGMMTSQSSLTEKFGYQNSTHTAFYFTRKLDTGVKKDAVLEPNTTMSICYAWSPHNKNAIKFHEDNYGAMEVKFSSTGGLMGNVTIKNHFQWHAICMLVAWAFLPIVARFAMHYFKWNMSGNILHILSGFATVTITVVNISIFWANPSKYDMEYEGKKYIHKTGGIVIFGVAIFQLVWGVITKLSFIAKNANHYIYVMSFIHKLTGSLLILYSIYQIYTGMSFIWPEYQYLVFIWYPFVILVEVCMQVLIKRVLSQKKVKQIEVVDLAERKGCVDFKDFDSYVTYEKRGKKVVLMDNGIYDITPLLYQHPGGTFIIDSMRFHDDVGRFFYGAYGFSTKVQKHRHSFFAERLMKKKFLSALLTIPQKLVVSQRGREGVYGEEEICNMPHKWIVTESRPLTSNTSIFYLKSDYFTVNPRERTLANCGRHFKVTARIRNELVTRFYTTCFSLSNERIFQRNQMTSNYRDDRILGIQESFGAEEGMLPLVIKEYKPIGKMSQHFHSVSKSSLVRVPIDLVGPCGLGLGLTDQSFGYHIAFAAGTGILPFLDLFDLVLESLLAPSNSPLPTKFLKKFKMVVFASFPSREDTPGIELMEKCMKACLNAKETVIEFNLRFSDQTSERYDRAFMETRKDILTQAQNIYICGPPSFNERVPDHLSHIGVPREAMYFI